MLKKGLSKSVIALFFLGVYYISLSSSLFHTHDHTHDHSIHDKLICESLLQNSNIEINCSHESHLSNLEEACDTCDYFLGHDKVILTKSFSQILISYDVDVLSIFSSVNLHDNTNYLNKSPPLVI